MTGVSLRVTGASLRVTGASLRVVGTSFRVTNTFIKVIQQQNYVYYFILSYLYDENFAKAFVALAKYTIYYIFFFASALRSKTIEIASA
ncbi:hypothetical protein CAPN001_05600 [Capnocytophaga stomatis]|uniref:hypothetical protein n=1 Tax=Capnocytophaga stomatis TaxID=1848904 RepID=UPI001950DA2B|nr:hypothetical protein [Capnocytophaga stomatis]GIJ95991.1 hypothetical protein CAPN001_05600 [Capnocytophaga stomatis]